MFHLALHPVLFAGCRGKLQNYENIVQLKKIHKLTLKNAFDSTFHDKLDFDDFLKLDVAQEYNSFHIRKKIVFNPSDKLRKYLRFLNSFIFNYALINPTVVHSYRRGFNAYTAIRDHSSSKYFFKTDIQDFFYSITTRDIEYIIDFNLNESPISDISTYKDELLNLISVNNTLPVGFSTSPGISNTCLYVFDNALEEYCSDQDIIYTRYSDDIILSSRSNNMKEIEGVISQILISSFDGSFRLNKKKTRHTHKGSKIKLLGMVILPSGKISVDIRVKNQIEILLYFYTKDKEKFSNYMENKYQGGLSTISGQLNYINTIDKSYLNKLRKKYGNYIVDAFFHKTIK